MLIFFLTNASKSHSENKANQTFHISGTPKVTQQGSGSNILSHGSKAKKIISAQKKKKEKSLKEKNKENYNLTLKGLAKKIKRKSKFTPKK